MDEWTSGSKEFVSSGVISKRPGTLRGIHGYNSAVQDIWLMLFDAKELPEDGTEPKRIVRLPRQREFHAGGFIAKHGICWCLSAEVPFKKHMAHYPVVWLRAEFE